MKIGIFGGTFNPTHKGHLESLEQVKNKLELDKILIIPSNITPEKEHRFEKISTKDRLNILKLSLKDFGKNWIKLELFEIKQGGVSFTYKTIKYLEKVYDNAEIWFIMGDDRYEGFKNWNNYSYLRKTLRIAILKRHNVKTIKKIDERDIYFKDQIIPISSNETLTTQIWNNLFPSAKKYIAKKYLYLKELTYRQMVNKRLEHVMSVATHAKRLYKQNSWKKWNAKYAYIAGLVHDNAKYISEKRIRKFLGDDYKDIPAKALHGFATAKWLEEEYGMKNKKIIDSISKHTLASGEMSLFDKVIYVSDKISNDRLSRKNYIWRRLAYQDLELTFRKILRESSENLLSNNVKLHKWTKDGLKNYPYENAKETFYKNGKNKRRNK